jgi:hypothetical protein
MSVILRVNRDLKEMLIEVSEKWLPTINCGMPANAQFMPASLLEGTTSLTKGANAAVAVAAIKASNFKLSHVQVQENMEIYIFEVI